MNSAIEVGEPDWRPLERALPSEYCEDFMYIAHVGDIVLYENRRDAELRPTRFEFEGLEDQTFVVVLAEQHILAILEESVAA